LLPGQIHHVKWAVNAIDGSLRSRVSASQRAKTRLDSV